MINIKQTITRVGKIAKQTKEEGTALELIELQSELRVTQYANEHTWEAKSIIIGIFIGIALGILIFGSDVHADEINFPVTSWHSQDRNYYNNQNYGIGYSYDYTKNQQWKIGAYKNSFYKTSVYLGGDFHMDSCIICVGVFVGGVTGYSNIINNETPGNTRNLNAVQLMILPNVKINLTKKHSVTIGYMPEIGEDSLSFATLTYNYGF